MNEWLYSIASSLVLDMLRRYTLIAWHFLDVMAWSLEATEACGPRTHSNGKADFLEEHYRTVVVLRAEGYSLVEIVQTQGRTTLTPFLARAGESLQQHDQTLEQHQGVSV